MAEGTVHSGAGHLPSGAEGPPGPPPELPRQRRGVTPQMEGRYPDYDVLAQASHWDATTRRIVLERVAEVPPLRFFDAEEARTLGAFCDEVMAQDREPRIPVLAMVDAKLHARQLDGFRHHDLPEDPETWRLVAGALERAAAAAGCEDGFAAAGEEQRREIIESFSKGELDLGGLPAKKAWSVVMRGVVSAFYSHPWAWNEIGFGGPAYPRGYARIGAGQREHWESPPEFEPDPVRDVAQRGLE
jgi:hypothetical protein